MLKFSSLALGLVLAAGSLSAKAQTYGFDNSHTEISFKIKHWQINTVRGYFNEFGGEIKYDAAKPEKSSVNVDIDAASIDTRNERRDKHLKTADFFDVEKHPKLTFKSKKVEKGATEGSLLISGDLTIRGVTKAVVLDARITGTLVDGMGKERLGFEASTTVNRKDYGIAWNMENKSGTFMLADEVLIEINGEAVKK